MTDLVPILAPIALLDSASIIPICIVLLVLVLAGPRPLVRSMALLSGIFLAYLVAGLLIMFGLQSAFDAIDIYAQRVWQHPNSEELIFQILVGLILVVFGFRIARRRGHRDEKPKAAAMTAWRALLAGAAIAIVGLPGAVPYLAAIDLILRSGLPTNQGIFLLLLYNGIFIAPLVAIVALRMVIGDASQGFLDGVKGFLSRWGHRVVVFLMLALGVVLVADGVGWFLGSPLLPV